MKYQYENKITFFTKPETLLTIKIPVSATLLNGEEGDGMGTLRERDSVAGGRVAGCEMCLPAGEGGDAGSEGW